MCSRKAVKYFDPVCHRKIVIIEDYDVAPYRILESDVERVGPGSAINAQKTHLAPEPQGIIENYLLDGNLTIDRQAVTDYQYFKVRISLSGEARENLSEGVNALPLCASDHR
jgi:hypothetical protein